MISKGLRVEFIGYLINTFTVRKLKRLLIFSQSKKKKMN